jgi:IS5 family transposase
MMKRRGGRQEELIPRSKRPVIPIDPSHQLAVLTDELNWDELLGLAEEIRSTKLKSNAGRPPHLRALVGALLLKATRDLTFREAEDLIRYYAPARYLCGLTETEWSPDHNTLHDFEALLAEEGVRLINEYVVKLALKEKLTFSSLAVGDTTAQEAAIPYPNEMRLMAAFMSSVAAAGTRAGKKLKQMLSGASEHFQGARKTLREFRLFGKTRERRRRGVARMMGHVRAIQAKLKDTLQGLVPRVRGYGKVAFARVRKLHETMQRLLPQIQYWHRTGWVAAKKVISLSMPKLYSVPRGKWGKDIEFGLQWGITRLKGGFVLAHVAADRRELVDTRYVLKSVEECRRLSGRVPRAYAYDRAGHSAANVEKLRDLGVRHIGLAPRGRTPWDVNEAMKGRLVSERVKVEGSIGTLKSRRYGFNRPRARSEAMMGVCGQRAVLGMNLAKMVRGLAERNGFQLTTS